MAPSSAPWGIDGKAALASADPLPDVADARPPYRIEVMTFGPQVHFRINGLPIFTWIDDGATYGPVLAGGRIGFRQMAPLVAEYAHLEIREVLAAD